MRLKIQTPDQYEHKNMWIVFVLTSCLLLAGLIILYKVSSGQPDVALRTLRDLLNDTKAEGDFRLFVGEVILLGAIALGPFASLGAIIYYSRKMNKSPRFAFLDFLDSGVSLENTDPALSVFIPYAGSQCMLGVTTYIRRGPKGAVHRCIDHIALSFISKQEYHIIKQVGTLDFIRKILDFAPRFSSFSSEVRALYGETNEAETDLVNYVKEQIYNYRTYGQMLRYSNSQRKQVRLIGYMMVGMMLLFAFLAHDLLAEMLRDWKDPFSRFLFVLLVGAFLVVLVPGVRMCYFAHKDAQLAKKLTDSPSCNRRI